MSPPDQTHSAACTRDPRAIKRQRHALKRELRSMIEKRLGTRRCWWTWPLGHDYGGRRFITIHAAMRSDITRCIICGTPCSWDSFDFYDLARFAELHDIASEDELEPYYEVYRAA